ncbi:MAG: tetratricopeptide repeat protein [Fimbriimonadaceae bacterium]
MRPTTHQIAELFALPLSASGGAETASTKQRTMGRTPEECEQLGRACLTDGDVEAAIEHFRHSVELRGGEPSEDALINLGSAYEYADRAPQALRQYLKAVRAKRDNPEPLVGLSDLYKRQGRFREAIEKLEAALVLEPESPYLLFKLAETLRAMGEPTRALAAGLAVVQVKPDDAFYHYWIGDLLVCMAQYSDALEALRAAIELSPGDDFLYLRVAVPFWRIDRRAEAVKAIRLASDLDPEKNLYHGLLEALLTEMGQIEEADLESARADMMDRYDHDTLDRTLAEMGIET